MVSSVVLASVREEGASLTQPLALDEGVTLTRRALTEIQRSIDAPCRRETLDEIGDETHQLSVDLRRKPERTELTEALDREVVASLCRLRVAAFERDVNRVAEDLKEPLDVDEASELAFVSGRRALGMRSRLWSMAVMGRTLPDAATISGAGVDPLVRRAGAPELPSP